MTPDTIFAFHSMSKPITSLAAMMLIDEGKLALTDAVSKYIPLFAGTKVGMEITKPDGSMAIGPVPPIHPVTIRELMRHTSHYFYFPGDGFGYGYGLAVRTDPGNAKPPPAGPIGELKWDSSSGTYFGVDPKLDMVYVLMQQTQNGPGRITPAFKVGLRHLPS